MKPDNDHEMNLLVESKGFVFLYFPFLAAVYGNILLFIISMAFFIDTLFSSNTKSLAAEYKFLRPFLERTFIVQVVFCVLVVVFKWTLSENLLDQIIKLLVLCYVCINVYLCALGINAHSKSQEFNKRL